MYEYITMQQLLTKKWNKYMCPVDNSCTVTD